MNNAIYVRRKNKLYIPEADGQLPNDYLLNALHNIQALGYTFSNDVIDKIQHLPVEKFKPFYIQLVEELKAVRGANVAYKPMYPDFPEQVVNAGNEELNSNAFWHYLGDWLGQRILPGYIKTPRLPLQDDVNLTVLHAGTKEDFNNIFTHLVGAKTSISETDKEDVLWYIKNYGNHVNTLLPAQIPVKENAAFVVSAFLKTGLDAQPLFDKHIKTATDVLRVAAAYSGGDVSLAENTKFVTFPKRVRRQLLQAIENAGNRTEDMLRYPNRFKRLGEKLHPYDYQNRYPQTCEAFDVVRNKLPFNTFNHDVEQWISHSNMEGVAEMLKARPGEFARRLDKLLREAYSPDYVLTHFTEVADKVSTPVLLQVQAHFEARHTPRELRVFFPKGQLAKVRAIAYNLPALQPGVAEKVSAICEQALLARFATYKPLGNVFLEDELKNYNVPFGLRSASKGLKTVARGSRVKLPAGNTIRFFIYWKDGYSRTDIDLSALALNADSKHVSTIAYYNLRDTGAHHSGDITSAPDGASEFIDLEIDTYRLRGIRYVVMCVNAFTEQPYCDLPVCYAGFMMRSEVQSGEVYEPQTVAHKFDLTANTQIAIPFIIDLHQREVIWTDLALTKMPKMANNVWNNLSALAVINKSMTQLVRPNLHKLFEMHIKARGQQVWDITQANTIFGVNQGIQPTDTDVIVSEYL